MRVLGNLPIYQDMTPPLPVFPGIHIDTHCSVSWLRSLRKGIVALFEDSDADMSQHVLDFFLAKSSPFRVSSLITLLEGVHILLRVFIL